MVEQTPGKRVHTDDVVRVGRVPGHAMHFVADGRVDQTVLALAMMFFVARWMRGT